MKKNLLAGAAVLSAFAGVTAPAIAQSAHVHSATCNHQDVSFEGSAQFGSDSLSGLVQPAESIMAGGNLNIVLNNLGGVEPGTDAFKGFNKAAEIWSKVLNDPITVRLDVRFAALGPGILGSTGSTTNTASYATIKSALAADRTSFRDNKAVKNLQDGPLVFTTNEPGNCTPGGVGCQAIDVATRVLDADNTFDNNNINVNTALVKALGGTPTYAVSNPGGRDGSVSFSNSFTWDFDPSDGITPGSFDFVGVTVHEIGHALGFRSGVDTNDVNSLPFVAPPGRAGLDGIAWVVVHDLFRYEEFDGEQQMSMTTLGVPCFSIDRGENCLGLLSTGRNVGDGRQASHWKDDVLLNTPTPLGVMDPTATGIGGLRPPQVITQLDLIAFDAMGWDLFAAVPQPASLALFGLGIAGLMASRRRKA